MLAQAPQACYRGGDLPGHRSSVIYRPLGYLPEWQSVLVLEGQFNVSRQATDHLVISLLAVLPTEGLGDELS